MTEEIKANDWSKGIHNLSAPNRVPEGFARDMLNLYPAGGRLTLRPGTEEIYAGTAVRGLFPVAGRLICVDGDELKDAVSGVVLGAVPPRGQVSGAVMNDQLYLSVGPARAIFNATTGLHNWGVAMPFSNGSTTGVDATRTAEHQRRGTRLRRYTLTQVDADGIESGAREGSPLGNSVNLPLPTAGTSIRLYVTEPDGSMYYLQGEYTTAQAVQLGPTNAGGLELQTMFMDAPPPAEFMVASGGCIVLSSANFVYHTPPMQPHLVDLESGFFMYPAPVTAMCEGKDGVYLSADKCYKLEGLGTDNVRQKIILEYPAVPGTMVTLPEGYAAWATEYGAAIEATSDRGFITVTEPTKQSFVPGKSGAGSSGSVEHNGERLFIANVRSDVDNSPLAAVGFFEAEVTRP